jgi:phospholipid transport system substrate-binding protein
MALMAGSLLLDAEPPPAPAQQTPSFKKKANSLAGLVAKFAGVASLILPHPIQAGEPLNQVRSTIDQALKILNDPKLATPAAEGERRDRLRQVIYPRFDFAEMARRSLGPYWRSITFAEQQEFVKLFTAMAEEAYIGNVESYHGEKIVYEREIEESDFAEVGTVIVDRGEEITIDYRLHEADGQWKVYDVIIENVSLVSNYRSQFSRFLASNSFAKLLDRLRE